MRKYTLNVGWDASNRFDTTVERTVVIKAINNAVSYTITATSGIPSTTVPAAPTVAMGAEFTVKVPAGSYLWFAGTGDVFMLVQGPSMTGANGTFAPSALKGFGRLVRDTDLVCAANVYTSLFRNCSIQEETGAETSINGSGYLVVPAGVEYMRLSTSQFIGSVPANTLLP